MKKMCPDAGHGLISWISISEDYLRLSEDGIHLLPMVCQLVQWYTVHQRIGADALVKWEGGLKRGYFLMEGRLSPPAATGGAFTHKNSWSPRSFILWTRAWGHFGFLYINVFSSNKQHLGVLSPTLNCRKCFWKQKARWKVLIFTSTASVKVAQTPAK